MGERISKRDNLTGLWPVFIFCLCGLHLFYCYWMFGNCGGIDYICIDKKIKAMKKEEIIFFAKKVWAIRPEVTPNDILSLMRIAWKLHRLDELCCGVEHNGVTVVLEFDEDGRCFRCHYWAGGERRWKIKDPYISIVNKLKKICSKHNLYYYHQGDPRGNSLFIAGVPLDSQNYLSDGIAVPF